MNHGMIADLMQQAPVAGVFAFFAWLNFRQTVKTLDHYQTMFSTSLGRILDQLAVLEERTRKFGDGKTNGLRNSGHERGGAPQDHTIVG